MFIRLILVYWYISVCVGYDVLAFWYVYGYLSERESMFACKILVDIFGNRP